MADTEYTGLTVTLRKTDQGDHYVAGVEADGVFVRLAAIPAPEFEQRVVEAAAAAAALKSATK